MPVITFEIGKLKKEQKTQIIKEFTESASRITGLPEEDFYVFLKENEADNVGIGGRMLSTMKESC